MKRISSVLVLLITLLACQPEGRVYEDHQKLSPDVEWKESDKREFIVPVDDIEKAYKMSLSFRYATGFQFHELKVKVKEIAPNGIERTYDYVLKIREENGDYIGDPGYDIWDLEHVVEPNKQYQEAGEYHYIIKHDMPQDPLYFAMEIGLILDEQ